MEDVDITTHYICTGGCNGMSPEPGECQAVGCAKNGRALAPCSCTDGKHEAEPETPEE